jgi:D-psicose/D-tagatose/L-ribulose 3-epimerase
MNRLGAYFTYWTDRYDTDYDECIRRAAALGFDCVGIRGTGIVKFSREKREATRRLAEDLGVGLTFVAALSGVDISSEDPGSRDAAKKAIADIVMAVAEMRGTILAGSFYADWHGTLPLGVADKRPWLDRSASVMRDLCGIAGDCGVELSLEILNRYESCLLNTAAEGMDYLERVGSRNIGLLLDTFHMNIEEKSLPDAIATAGDRLNHFHVGEANRNVPGPGGHIDWDGVFAALDRVGYKGVIEFEPFVVMGTEISKNICLWRDLTGGRDIDELMAESLAFVRERLASVRAG